MAEKVIDIIIRKCCEAYRAKKPLIMIDTYDTEIADAVALSGRIVELCEATGRSARTNNLEYYKYISKGEAKAANTVNYCCSLNGPAVHASPMKADTVSSGAPAQVMTDMVAHINKIGFPVIFALKLNGDRHLSDDDIRKTGQLRKYVDSYVRDFDDNSLLRRSCVILYGNISALPRDLINYTEIIEEPFPSVSEIMDTIDSMMREAGPGFEVHEELRKLALLLKGFSICNVRSIMTRLLEADEAEGRRAVFSPDRRRKMILTAKKQVLLGNGGILQLYEDDAGSSDSAGQDSRDIGGMERYTDWINKNVVEQLKDPLGYRMKRGIDDVKGVLLCGAPGCGKSEAAKVLRSKLEKSTGTEFPMVKLSIDSLMEGLVGSSERNMRLALSQANAMAPCILWIDEIDKGLSAASSSGNGDGGTFKRMFGRLLTWMQEENKGCFIFATANDISRLPDEFFRSGRLDALFSVFLPTYEECRQIFLVQMKRAESRKEALEKENGYDSGRLFSPECMSENTLDDIMGSVMKQTSERLFFLNGADIEKIVNCALKKFDDSKLTEEITVTDWKSRIAETLNDPTIVPYGGSEANMNALAASYLRLLRGNFIPACGESQLLFRKENYKVNVGEKNGSITVKAHYERGTSDTGMNTYDRNMFIAIWERMERLATNLELNYIKKLTE